MKEPDLTVIPSESLVDLFGDLSAQQGDALIVDDTRRSNRLIKTIWAIDIELRARGLEARLALRRLLSHNNAFVRINAAVDLLGLVPQEARTVLQQIDDSRVQPEALHAGMILLRYDRGEWVPD